MPNQPEPGGPVTAPDVCPFCKSTDIATTSKSVDVSTYWRCTACGQVWNASRLQNQRQPWSDRFR